LLARVHYSAGRYDDGRRLEDEVAATTRANDVYDRASWRATQAMLLAREARFAEAEAIARENVAFSEEGDFLAARAEAWAGLSEVLRLAGRVDDAVAAIGRVVELYEQKGNLVAAERARRQLATLKQSS
jgi:hypothetical protein